MGNKNPPKRGAREVLPNALVLGAALGRFLGKSGGPGKYFQLVGSTSPDFHPQNYFPEPRSTSSLVLFRHNFSRALNLNPKIGKIQVFYSLMLSDPDRFCQQTCFFSMGFFCLVFPTPMGSISRPAFSHGLWLPILSSPNGFYKHAEVFLSIYFAQLFRPPSILEASLDFPHWFFLSSDFSCLIFLKKLLM